MVVTLVLMELCLGSDGKQLELTLSYANNDRPVFKITIIQVIGKEKIGFYLNLRKVTAIQFC